MPASEIVPRAAGLLVFVLVGFGTTVGDLAQLEELSFGFAFLAACLILLGRPFGQGSSPHPVVGSTLSSQMASAADWRPLADIR